MKGIVNKPQFDLKTFIPGTALRIKNLNNFEDNDIKRGTGPYNCLVYECNPLKLTIAYFKKDNQYTKGSIEKAYIKIEDVSYYHIEFLVPEGEKEQCQVLDSI